MADCPVCGRSSLATFLRTCPQCNADLECFQWLDALHEKEPDRTSDLAPVQGEVSKQGTWLLTLFVLLSVGAMLAGIFLLDRQRIAHHVDRQIFEEERAHWQVRVISLERQLSQQLLLAQLEGIRLQRRKELNATLLQVEEQLSALLVQQGLSSLAKRSAEDAEAVLEESVLALQRQLAHFLIQQTPPSLPPLLPLDRKKLMLRPASKLTDRRSSSQQ